MPRVFSEGFFFPQSIIPIFLSFDFIKEINEIKVLRC